MVDQYRCDNYDEITKAGGKPLGGVTAKVVAAPEQDAPQTATTPVETKATGAPDAEAPADAQPEPAAPPATP